MIIRLMEVSPFGLSKVGMGEEMDIPREGIRLPHVKKNRQQQPRQTDKPLLGKEIRLALPNPRMRARREGMG